MALYLAPYLMNFRKYYLFYLINSTTNDILTAEEAGDPSSTWLTFKKGDNLCCTSFVVCIPSEISVLSCDCLLAAAAAWILYSSSSISTIRA